MKLDQRSEFTSRLDDFDLDHFPADPIELFKHWYEVAERNLPKGRLANGVCLSTIGLDQRPKARWVLLREFNLEGYFFYTNYQSDKGKEIEVCPEVALTLYWDFLHQQIRIEGRCHKASKEISDRYFLDRPFLSQVSAASSDQSRELENKNSLLKKVTVNQRRYRSEQNVPRPDHWGGYVIVPDYYEFWQGRENRLHDRLVYRLREGDRWDKKLLQP